VTVNGEQRELGEGSRVVDLLAALDLAQRRVAVEVNKVLVRRAKYDTHELHDGDRIEIVTLVGGG